uniref:Actin-related protein 2/3 complex subunit 4 n=1 Tax=Coptotermes formosanus TaxID=36987 RepID=R4V381_COPFO|nr:actin-related protein [Coptotermes formosanus]
MAANPLQPYLNAIRRTLEAALCIRNFPSEDVERHNKPEIEVQDSTNNLIGKPLIISRSPLERTLIESSINSVRISVKIKQVDDVDAVITKMYMRFLTQRADQFRILRRKPIEGYTISFLITSIHCEEMILSKLIDWIIQFMYDIDKELSDMKITLSKRARVVAEEYMKQLL